MIANYEESGNQTDVLSNTEPSSRSRNGLWSRLPYVARLLVLVAIGTFNRLRFGY